MTKGRGGRAAARGKSRDDDRRGRRGSNNGLVAMDRSAKSGGDEASSYRAVSGGGLATPNRFAVYHGVGHFGNASVTNSLGIPVGIPYNNVMAQPEMVASLGYAGQLVPHNIGSAMLVTTTAAMPHAYVGGQRIAPRELPPYVCLPNKKKGNKENDGGEEVEAAEVEAACNQTEDQTSLINDGQGASNVSNSESEESVSKKKNKSTNDVCEFFLKTGSCAYGTNCKFTHPFDQAPVVL